MTRTSSPIPPGRSTAGSASCRPSTREPISIATSRSSRTTPTTRAASSRAITSVTIRVTLSPADNPRQQSGVLLLTECLLDRQPERHASEPRNTPEHAERLAHPGSDRRAQAYFDIYEQTDWHYGTSPNFYPVGPP